MNSVPVTVRLCAAATSVLLASTVPTQSLAEGYAATTVVLPSNAGNVAETPFGLVWFDGQQVVLQPATQPSRVLLQLPAPAFGAFTIPLAPDLVLFAESSNGSIWLLPLAGATPTAPLTNIVFPFDATALDAGRILVSAKVGGFAAPDNELLVVDLQTGQAQTLASLPGASGPVAIAPNGDLLYATASASFPTPPGTTSILRFPRATVENALAQQLVLGASHALTVRSGLDAAGDLAFDDDGDLFFVDWLNRRIGEIDDAVSGTATLAPVFVDYGPAAASAATLQFLPQLHGVFEPFQPAAGRLLVHETDFFGTSIWRRIQATRPTLTCSAGATVPSGAFSFDLAGGPANGTALAALALAAPLGEQLLTVQGYEQPLRWDGVLVTAPLWFVVPCDALGRATLPLANPGVTPSLSLTAQFAVLAAAGTLGSSPPRLVTIGP